MDQNFKNIKLLFNSRLEFLRRRYIFIIISISFSVIFSDSVFAKVNQKKSKKIVTKNEKKASQSLSSKVNKNISEKPPSKNPEVKPPDITPKEVTPKEITPKEIVQEEKEVFDPSRLEGELIHITSGGLPLQMKIFWTTTKIYSKIKIPPKNLKLNNKSTKKKQKNIIPIQPAIAPIEPIQFETELTGKIDQLNTKIIWEGKGVKTAKDGTFSITVPILATSTQLTLQLVSPKGELELHSFELRFSDLFEKPIRRWSVNAGLGYSILNFSQTQFEDLSEGALTVKGGARFQIKPNVWDVGLSGYWNAFLLKKQGSEAIQFYGLNLRGGYTLPFCGPPLRCALHGGIYFTSVRTSNELLGYGSISGPQIFPTFDWKLNSGLLLTSYFKFSPIGNGIGFLGFANREIAGGGAIIFPPSVIFKNFGLSLSIDVANLQLELIDSTDVAQKIISQSYSFGFGLSY